VGTQITWLIRFARAREAGSKPADTEGQIPPHEGIITCVAVAWRTASGKSLHFRDISAMVACCDQFGYC